MKLVVCPASQVARAVSEHAPSHAISLLSPEAVAPKGVFQVSTRLDLRFHDIAEPRAGLIEPTPEMVRRLIDFGLAWPGRAPLLVHCYAGVSRSTAAGYVLACARSSPGQEAGLAERLRVAAPSATPNRLIVALADQLLGRDGRMDQAIVELGRGSETFEGDLFSLYVGKGKARDPRSGCSRGDQKLALMR